MVKICFDFMGVLFRPNHLIRDGFAIKLKEKYTYEEIKRAYRKATIGDSSELNQLIPIKEQKKILLEIVEPMFDFSRLKKLSSLHQLYGITNLPLVWAYTLYEKYLEDTFSGAFISGSIGIEKPDIRIYEFISKAIGNEVIFLDDREENLEPARKIGWKTYLIKGSEDIEQILPKLI